jgi:hypothetical protein
MGVKIQVEETPNYSFSKKERAEIYLKAAQIIKEHVIARFACHAIAEAAAKIHMRRIPYDTVIESNYPEFYLFKDNDNGVWLSGDGNDAERLELDPRSELGCKLRNVVLLLCHEMCND